MTIKPKKDNKLAGRKKQPIRRIVSSKAIKHLRKYLSEFPPPYKYEIDAFYWLLDLFYRLPTYNKNVSLNTNGYLAISSKYFQAHITNNYAKHLKTLTDSKIILCDHNYSYTKNVSKGYKLNPDFDSKPEIVQINPGSTTWKRITQKRNKIGSHKKMQEHIKQLKQAFTQIQFDGEGARKYIDELLESNEININQYNQYFTTIDAMETGEKNLFFNRNTTNLRVDTNLTNMKKELRNFIIENFVQIDLKNSQPYLINYLFDRYLVIRKEEKENKNYSYCRENLELNELNPAIERLLRGLNNPPNLDMNELEEWNNNTRKGIFYELFMKELSLSRRDAKEIMIATLYSRNQSEKYRDSQELFRSVFPSISELLFLLKESSHRKLSIALQLLESQIFIDEIARLICEKEITIYTVHDSIIVPKEFKDTALEIMGEVFIKYFGEIPTFEVELLSPKALSKDTKILEPNFGRLPLSA